MDSNGKLFDRLPQPTAGMLLRYQKLVATDFAGLADEEFSDDELDWLQRIHDKHLDYYREERRMHFGAFALVGVCFILLFPALLTSDSNFPAIAAVEALLFALLIPYTFVYRRYEEGVRRAMGQSMLLENARRVRAESESL